MFAKGQWITLVVIAVVLGFVVAGCAPSPTPVPASATVLAAAKAFNAGDVEGSLAYYTDDVVVKLVGLPPGEPDTFAGKEQVRAWFKSLVATHYEIQYEVTREESGTVTSKTQSWSDPTRALGVVPVVATEVDVVKNGKITGFTWTISPESAAKLQAAMAAMQAQAAQPTPTVSVPKALIGTYKTTITLQDMMDPRYKSVSGVVLGDGQMQFKEDGHCLVKPEKLGVLTAEYTATQDTLVLGKESGGDWGCTKDGYGPGTYKWTTDGKMLTLTAVSDDCPGRVLFSTAHPLVKVQ